MYKIQVGIYIVIPRGGPIYQAQTIFILHTIFFNYGKLQRVVYVWTNKTRH